MRTVYFHLGGLATTVDVTWRLVFSLLGKHAHSRASIMFIDPFIRVPGLENQRQEGIFTVDVVPYWVCGPYSIWSGGFIGSWCPWAVCGGGRHAALSLSVTLLGISSGFWETWAGGPDGAVGLVGC